MQDINSNAVYVQIAPDNASNDSNDNTDDDNKVKCELYWTCAIIVVSMCLAGGLGIYFLIKNH